MRTRVVVISVAVVVMLAAVSTVALAAATHGFRRHTWFGDGTRAGACTVPSLSGSVVQVTLANMGGPMMGGGVMGGSVSGGMMRLRTDTSTVAHGTVSFAATNVGSVNHELVVLPLPAGQIVGTRAIGDDGKIDEQGSVGEASNTCGAGTGDGIAPGSSGWVTLTLAPGRYELVCNLPGHYAAGMYAQLTVT